MSQMLTAILAGLVVWGGSSLICAILWGGWRTNIAPLFGGWLRRRQAQRRADEDERLAIRTAARNWPQRRR